MGRAPVGHANRRIALVIAALAALLALIGWFLSRAPRDASDDAPSRTIEPLRPTRRPDGLARAVRSDTALEPGRANPTPTSLAPEPPADVAPLPHVLVAGSVRDARTGEPVPELTVALSGGGVEEICTTDAAGRFATLREFPPVGVRASLSDLGWPVGSAKLEHPALPFEIQVAIGPTYPLHFDPWQPGGALQVRLVEHTTGPWAALLDVDEKGQIRFLRDEEREAGVALVRGAPGWVRFPRAFQASSAESSAWLVLEDALGQRWCEAEAPGTSGIRPSVRFALGAGLASIAGTVGQVAVQRVPSRVCAVPQEESQRIALGWHHAEVGADGRFELVGLRAGAWRVVAYAKGLYSDEAYVDLQAEQMAVLDLRLAEPALDVRVVATSKREPDLFWAATPHDLAPFHPPFLGLGSLDALPRMQMDLLAQDRRSLREERHPQFERAGWTGSGKLAFTTSTERQRLVFQVDVPEYARGTAWYVLGPGSTTDGVRTAKEPSAIDPDEDAPWMAGARGCRPEWGRLRDVKSVDGLRVARVRLDPGWGVQVHAFELGFEPKAVSLAFATRFAGRMDPESFDEIADEFGARPENAAGPPLALGLGHVAAARALKPLGPGELPQDWSALAEQRGIGSAIIGGAGPGRIGIAIDRLRYRVADGLPYVESSYGHKRTYAGLNRYALACERRAKVVPAKPPVRVEPAAEPDGEQRDDEQR
jgi:hypothetical protein